MGSAFAFSYGWNDAVGDPVGGAAVGMVVAWGVPLVAAGLWTRGWVRVALLVAFGVLPAVSAGDLLARAIFG